MKQKTKFYNDYHSKNSNFYRVIGDGNATYYYLLPVINRALRLMSGKKSLKVLDVGCGVGSLAFYVASKGYTVDAYDVSSDAIKICKEFKSYSGMKNIHFYKGDIETIKTNTKYDLVICTEVIEHVENDGKFLNKINKICAKNGLLLLSTPSSKAPLYVLGLLKEFDSKVGHLRRYSENSVHRILSKNSFRILSSTVVEGIIRNSLFTIKPLGFFLKAIKGPLVPIFHFIDGVSASLFGGSDIIILAQKK